MREEEKIEMARNLLNNAVSMNMRKEIVLRISQKIDEYIFEYFYKKQRPKVHLDKRE